MAHDENVVRLLERDARSTTRLRTRRPAVIAEVAVQLLDPRLGSEDEGDLRLAHGVARRAARFAIGSNGAATRNGGAPVARTRVTVPVSSADAIRAAAAGSTASVTLASSEPCNGPAPRPENASTCTSVAT